MSTVDEVDGIRRTTVTVLGRTWQVMEIGAPVWAPLAGQMWGELLRMLSSDRAQTAGCDAQRTAIESAVATSPLWTA